MIMLTLEYLKSRNACEDGIDFVVKQNLIGFPFEKLNCVEGDFNDLVSWLKEKISDKSECDDRGNIIKNKTRYGTYCYEYDKNNNMIKKTSKSGYSLAWEYDDRGNKIKHTNLNTGFAYLFEYDDRDNCIKHTALPSGATTYFEYDDQNNKIKSKSDDEGFVVERTFDSYGNILTYKSNKYKNSYTYEYDVNGNLLKQFSIVQNIIVGQWEYDDRGNQIKFFNGDKVYWTREYRYHPNGRLYVVFQDGIEVLIVPYFD